MIDNSLERILRIHLYYVCNFSVSHPRDISTCRHVKEVTEQSMITTSQTEHTTLLIRPNYKFVYMYFCVVYGSVFLTFFF